EISALVVFRSFSQQHHSRFHRQCSGSFSKWSLSVFLTSRPILGPMRVQLLHPVSHFSNKFNHSSICIYNFENSAEGPNRLCLIHQGLKTTSTLNATITQRRARDPVASYKKCPDSRSSQSGSLLQHQP
ncbi:hypothetical protein CEXT_214991, partial [Caerostris extrusa]